MTLIQPKYLKLSELLNGRLFRIPPYQRAYSWESKQRSDLFADITNLRTSNGDAVHFMATMVGLNRAKRTIATDEFHEIEVVDGQQRLTTLIILYKCLALSLDTKDKKEGILSGEIDALLVKEDDGSLLLLQTNHDTSNYFADFLRNGTSPQPAAGKTLADRLLLQAILDCKEFVEKWPGTRIELGAILKNRLALIFHEIADEVSVYTVFEVLNSRGLDVAWLDRLKSALMGAAFETGKGSKTELIRELHQIWGEIYRCVGLHQGRSSEALRFAATLKSKDVLSKVQSNEAAVKTLRELVGKSPRGTVEVSRWILMVVEAVDGLMTDHRRGAVTKIAHARLLAVAIRLAGLSQQKQSELLDAWEKATFRIFGMCRKDARTRVGDYVRLSRTLLGAKFDHKSALASIQDLATGEFAVDQAVEKLRNANCYEGWEEELRYFMFRYEEHLANESGQKFSNAQWERIWATTPAQSIEHICPQSDGVLAPTKSKKTVFVHRLGNLVLLPPKLNSKLSNHEPPKKAAEYEKTGLLIAAKLKPALKLWSPAAVEKREDALLKWAAKEWAD